MYISTVLKNLGPLLKRNSSTILTGIGVAGSIGSTVLAVKATPRAQGRLDEAYITKNRYRLEPDEDGKQDGSGLEPLTPLEVVKLVWKDYVPALGLQVVTVGCIIGAQKLNMRKQAALITVATVSESAFREYQERMAVEAPAKDRKVRDDIAAKKVEDNPVSKQEVMLVGNGDQLFYESHTDRYFMSTMQKVQKAVNDLNFRILNQDYAALNEFYNLVGLKTVSQGEESGWTAEHPLELDYSTQMTDDDRAAIVIDYVRKPLGNYYKGFR